MALAETARLAVRIDLEGNAARGVNNLNRQVSGLGRTVGRVGSGFGQIASGVTRAGLFVGGAAVAGLGAAAKAAIEFEDAFAGVKKTVDEADLAAAGLSFEALEKSFRDMATEIPIAATEFARLGETAGALGVKAADIDDFVKTTALLGVTTDLTADAAADALGRIGTILGFTGKDYEDFADILVELGNKGASTESEIAEIVKRFAAEGEAAGLATSQIAGLASATASLGFAPERGGTALARVFANMGTNISLANKKGKAFASVTGRSISDLQKDLDRGEGMSIFLDVLKGIKGMSPTDANRTLKALGITNTSDRTIFRTMAENLPFVNEQLGIAADATGALSEEATKRFDTVRSKIQLLKNNLIEAGITIGEGFAPALGRAAEKLSTFLKDPGNKGELKALGEDIGKAIDDIDWQGVLRDARTFVGVLKGAFDWVMRIVGAFNALPTEIKGALAGLLAVNKLSGGLVGAGISNVVGGLAGGLASGLASRAPGVGRLFAQPVFVTNWPLGGLGGGAGAAGAVGGKGGGIVGALTKGIAIASIVGSVAAVIGEQQTQSNMNSAAAGEVRKTATVFLGQNPTTQQLLSAMGGVDKGIADLQSNPLHMLVQGDALNELKATKGAINQKLAANSLAVQRKGEQTVASVNVMKSTLRSQVQGSGSAIVAAIHGIPAPVVNVSVSSTSVTHKTTVVRRYGPSGGSRNADAADSRYGPN